MQQLHRFFCLLYFGKPKNFSNSSPPKMYHRLSAKCISLKNCRLLKYRSSNVHFTGNIHRKFDILFLLAWSYVIGVSIYTAYAEQGYAGTGNVYDASATNYGLGK